MLWSNYIRYTNLKNCHKQQGLRSSAAVAHEQCMEQWVKRPAVPLKSGPLCKCRLILTHLYNTKTKTFVVQHIESAHNSQQVGYGQGFIRKLCLPHLKRILRNEHRECPVFYQNRMRLLPKSKRKNGDTYSTARKRVSSGILEMSTNIRPAN